MRKRRILPGLPIRTLSAPTKSDIVVRLAIDLVGDTKVLFGIAYSMAKRGVTWSHLRDGLALAQANGTGYRLRYKSRRYVPIAQKYLAAFKS